jgi:hypothetical protein
MEKGEKGKGKLGREVLRWPGSESERSRVLMFPLLGMEAPDISRGASHLPVRRYVCKEPSSDGGPLQKEDKFML